MSLRSAIAELFGGNESPAKPTTFGMGDNGRPSGLDVRGMDLRGFMVDRRTDAIYDRLRFKAGSILPRVIRCFQYAVGQPDPYTQQTKMFGDTNMVISGQFPAPHDMIVRQFLFLFQPTCSGYDKNLVTANYRWEFKVMQKIMQREPMLVAVAEGKPENVIRNFGKGSWLNGAGDRENDSTSLIKKLGEGIAWDLGPTLNIYLPSLVHFELVLESDSLESARVIENDLDFFVTAHGSRDYPVQ